MYGSFINRAFFLAHFFLFYASYLRVSVTCRAFIRASAQALLRGPLPLSSVVAFSCRHRHACVKNDTRDSLSVRLFVRLFVHNAEHAEHARKSAQRKTRPTKNGQRARSTMAVDVFMTHAMTASRIRLHELDLDFAEAVDMTMQ
ncbi:MAG TPA: hypothetical protein VG320_25830 [Paraburkholderia sp.]|uniref:hypothetical protein n=1 Tax=Paraburkholderia sp. TaxID=1926495 RepID=UPI002DE9B1F4|nr:hypothetical protein [Paraburkholderia sp.]